MRARIPTWEPKHTKSRPVIALEWESQAITGWGIIYGTLVLDSSICLELTPLLMITMALEIGLRCTLPPFPLILLVYEFPKPNENNLTHILTSTAGSLVQLVIRDRMKTGAHGIRRRWNLNYPRASQMVNTYSVQNTLPSIQVSYWVSSTNIRKESNDCTYRSHLPSGKIGISIYDPFP